MYAEVYFFVTRELKDENTKKGKCFTLPFLGSVCFVT